jgi:outer membrane protein assembly factor BamB
MMRLQTTGLAAITAIALAVGAGSTAAVTPALAVSETTSYQGDAGHSGGVSDPALNGPLQVLWSARFTKGLSYPLVADGRVFVLNPPSWEESRATDLEVLDAVTGAQLWERPLPNATGLTYGDGAVYVVNQSGLVTAIDAVTGVTRWANGPSTPNIGGVGTPPVYYHGTIFYTGLTDDEGSAVVALDAQNGEPRWYKPMSTYYAEAGVAADAQGVYIGSECGYGASWALDGTPRWSTPTRCDGEGPGFGEQTVVADARVFTDFRSGAVLDTTSGAIVDEWARPYGARNPAFGAGYAAVLADGKLTIVDRATLTTVASYTPNPDVSEPLSQPFFVDGHVFTVDNRHHLIGVDAATATVSADVDLDSQLAPPNDTPDDYSGGIGVGGGVLAVATTDGRVVAVTAPGGPPIPPPDSPTPPDDPSTPPTDVATSATSAARAPSATVAAIPAAARRVAFPGVTTLRVLRGRGLSVTVTGARWGATVHAALTVGVKTVWHQTARVPKDGRLRLKAVYKTTRATTARLEIRVRAPHTRTLVVHRTLR